jgi:hypothetical protein
MRRSNGLSTAAICSALLMSLLAGSPCAAGGGNCQAKLVGKSFGCSIKSSNAVPSTNCFEFSTEGESQHFDFFDNINNFSCACDTTGFFKSPKFDSSPSSWECSDDSGTQIDGTLKGKKISGEGTDLDGNSLIYNCTQLTSGNCPS